MRELCPLVFCDPPVPLAVGSREAVCELLAGEHEQIHIKRFLQSWTRQEAYKALLIEGAARLDLNGQQVGSVTAEQAVYATSGAVELQPNDDGITGEVPDLK